MSLFQNSVKILNVGGMLFIASSIPLYSSQNKKELFNVQGSQAISEESYFQGTEGKKDILSRLPSSSIRQKIASFLDQTSIARWSAANKLGRQEAPQGLREILWRSPQYSTHRQPNSLLATLLKRTRQEDVFLKVEGDLGETWEDLVSHAHKITRFSLSAREAIKNTVAFRGFLNNLPKLLETFQVVWKGDTYKEEQRKFHDALHATLFFPSCPYILEKFTQLKTLSLRRCGITDECIIILARSLYSLPHLETLDLSLNKFFESSLLDIGINKTIALADGITSLPNLRTLDLSFNHFENEITPFLEHLHNKSSLHTLNLAWNELRNNGGTTLALYLYKFPNLHTLDVRCNKIGNKGVLSLAKTLPLLKNLHTLEFSCNDIGSEGTQALVNQALPKLTSLEEIDISGNNMSEIEILNLLPKLTTHPSLKELSITPLYALSSLKELGINPPYAPSSFSEMVKEKLTEWTYNPMTSRYTRDTYPSPDTSKVQGKGRS